MHFCLSVIPGGRIFKIWNRCAAHRLWCFIYVRYWNDNETIGQILKGWFTIRNAVRVYLYLLQFFLRRAIYLSLGITHSIGTPSIRRAKENTTTIIVVTFFRFDRFTYVKARLMQPGSSIMPSPRGLQERTWEAL